MFSKKNQNSPRSIQYGQTISAIRSKHGPSIRTSQVHEIARGRASPGSIGTSLVAY
jgi:hypothetical protein